LSMTAWDTETKATSYLHENMSKRERQKYATARDPYYVKPGLQPAKNTTLIAMLMFKNPHCVYCNCKLA